MVSTSSRQWLIPHQQAGWGAKDHVENSGAGSSIQEKDENFLFILGDALPVVPPNLVK